MAALILFLNNALSSFCFPTHFYPWTFLCCCCGAVFEGAAAFNRDLSTWQVGEVINMASSTYILPPPPLHKIGSFFVCLFFLFIVLALILFFNLYLSLDFSFCCCGAVFAGAGTFNGNLSAWQVRKVTTMYASKYTLSPPPPTPRSDLFLAASIFPFFFLWQH